MKVCQSKIMRSSRVLDNASVEYTALNFDYEKSARLSKKSLLCAGASSDRVSEVNLEYSDGNSVCWKSPSWIFLLFDLDLLTCLDIENLCRKQLYR